jgi:hypothetical protein
MPSKISTLLFALSVLLVLASVVQPPPDTVATPEEWGPQRIPEKVRAQREEILRLRRELVGRRILRTVREQLPKAKLPDVMTQFDIRLDPALKGTPDAEILRMIHEARQQIEGYPVYDSPDVGAETRDVCEEVPDLDPGAAPVLSCVEDESIVEASRSVVAIVDQSLLVWDDEGGQWVLTTWLLEKADTGSVGLCDSEPIRNSPSTTVRGTGFLIEEDVIATAGHVIYDKDLFDTVYFLFGYVMKRDGEPKTTFSKDDVYSGAELIASQTGDADFALVRLERAVVGRQPLGFRKSGKIESGAKLYMLGHPEGMTMKYAGEASITWNGGCAYFLSPLDARPGNSGSPVFNAKTHEVEGIMVRDAPTYVKICDCVVTGIHSETYGYVGADVVRTTRFAGLLEHPVTVLVRSQLPDDRCAVVEVAGAQYAFDSSEAKHEQFLPYDALGFYLQETVGEVPCLVRYQPDGGSVWDIKLHETSGYPMMVEACFR